ncbi:hypothetical protein [Syntrophobotulus glycolicus]|uniref:hypothetical protein n=1 Tax=Syntrophobotulus glycolicus TaxID=51197 RepID=UPI0011D1262E|nr:hypothetical protein [Syntrophobotulus glycolicus]
MFFKIATAELIDLVWRQSYCGGAAMHIHPLRHKLRKRQASLRAMRRSAVPLCRQTPIGGTPMNTPYKEYPSFMRTAQRTGCRKQQPKLWPS